MIQPVTSNARPVAAEGDARGTRRGGPPAAMSRSLPRFLIIGALSFAVDAGMLFVIHGVLKAWLPLATTLAFATAFTVNFGLNRLWAFGSTTAVGRQAARYAALTGLNLMLTVALVSGISAVGLHFLLAKAISAAVIAALNYFAYRAWVFR